MTCLSVWSVRRYMRIYLWSIVSPHTTWLLLEAPIEWTLFADNNGCQNHSPSPIKNHSLSRDHQRRVRFVNCNIDVQAVSHSFYQHLRASTMVQTATIYLAVCRVFNSSFHTQTHGELVHIVNVCSHFVAYIRESRGNEAEEVRYARCFVAPARQCHGRRGQARGGAWRGG